MASVLAIVSKAVFEKQAAGAGVGQVLALDQYGSTHKGLSPLSAGGAMFMVTVRPPDEQLWLVAVLESPKLGKTAWTAAANRVAITNISALKSKLKFATGTGIQAKPGTLGMSLQTPRTLTAEDEALIRSALKGGAATSAKPVKPAPMPVKAMKPAKPAKAAQAAKPAKPAKPAKAAPAPKATKSAAPTGDDAATVQAGLADDDGEGALLAALAWWRSTHAPAVADLVDAISARISGPPVATDIEFTKVASKKQPRDLGRLLPAITELAAGYLPTAAELLLAFPDDPRLSLAFGPWIVEAITTSTSNTPFWSKLFPRIQALGDTRVIAALEKRLAIKPNKTDWWKRFYGNISKTVEKLQAFPPPSKVDAKAVAALVKSAKALAPLDPNAAAPEATSTRDAAPKLTGALLAQAATHLAAGRITAAIDAMLERWRETRVPALADLIDRATRLLPTFDKPLIMFAKRAQAEWMAAFETDLAGHMPQLLRSFGVEGKLAPLQLAQLVTLPDDPRISWRLTEQLDRNVGGENGKYWKTVFELLARHRDVRTFAPVQRQYGDFVSTYKYESRPAKRFMEPMIREHAAGADAWKFEYSAEDKKLAASLGTAITKQLETTESRERALIAAIVAEPSADGPRLVYADWLQEREHPRGELIVLETRASRTKAEEKRLDELSEIPYMFGAFGDLFKEIERDRGLPKRAVTASRGNPLNWIAASRSPLAPVLEQLDLYYPGELTPESVQAFLTATTGLRVIENIGADELAAWIPDYSKRWKKSGKSHSLRLERL